MSTSSLPPKVSLRDYQINDLHDLVLKANNWQIAKNLTNQFPYPYSAKNGREFIEMAISFNPSRIKVILVDGSFAGAIGVHPQDDIFCKNAELGYWLAQDYWSRGIMTSAVKIMLPYIFDNFEINRVFARPFSTNLASQKVLENCGFILEARLKGTILKDGEVLDELIYAVRRR